MSLSCSLSSLFSYLPSVILPLSSSVLTSPPYLTVHGIFLSRFKRGYRPTRGEDERPLIARLTLHAHRLTFLGLDGKQTTVEAPLPRDFRAAIAQLERHSRR